MTQVCRRRTLLPTYDLSWTPWFPTYGRFCAPETVRRSAYFDGLSDRGRSVRPVPLAFLDGSGRRSTVAVELFYERLTVDEVVVLQRSAP